MEAKLVVVLSPSVDGGGKGIVYTPTIQVRKDGPRELIAEIKMSLPDAAKAVLGAHEVPCTFVLGNQKPEKKKKKRVGLK